MFAEDAQEMCDTVNSILKKDVASVYPHYDTSNPGRGGYMVLVESNAPEEGSIGLSLYFKEQADEYIESQISKESLLIKGIIE